MITMNVIVLLIMSENSAMKVRMNKFKRMLDPWFEKVWLISDGLGAEHGC